MASVTETKVPDFVASINNDYRSQIAHVFILHGNIYDYCDNTGRDLTVKQVFGTAYDDNLQKDVSSEAALDKTAPGLQTSDSKGVKVTRILATYNISQGLDFPHPVSAKAIQTMMKDALGEIVTDKFMKPVSLGKLIEFMNLWFAISKERAKTNKKNREEGKPLQPELLVTWLLQDADTIVPNGDISQIGPDRNPIVSIREWAQDEWLALRNRIILMTEHAIDLHTSIRSEITSTHIIRKPNLSDRRSYITGFDETVKKRAQASKTGKLVISENNSVTGINWAPDFDAEQCAIQSAGMNRKQLKDVFLKSWMSETPVDYTGILQRKQKALREEYQGMLDFKEPTFGFEEIGGHDHFKEYCRRRIIIPLQERDVKTCSRGALMTGPPGTGKSMLAMALAKEAKMNFMTVDLGKVFAGLVGESLHGDQEIYFCDKFGRQVERKTIRDAYKNGHLPCTIAMSKYGGYLIKEVPDLIRHDRKEKFVKIVTKHGKEVIVTEGHSVFTRAARKSRFGETGADDSGYLTTTVAGDLKPGMPLATLGYWIGPGRGDPRRQLREIQTDNLNVRLTPSLMELIGFWLGDGSKHGGKLRLSLGPDDQQLVERLKKFGDVSIDPDPRSDGFGATLAPDAIYAILVELGAAGKHSSAYNKRVPAWVFGTSDECVSALLRGYFSTDGCFSGHNLESSSANSFLSEDVSLLLARFGVVPYLDWKYEEKGHRYHRRLTVSKGADLAVFHSQIGFVQDHKQKALSDYLAKIGESITSRGKGKHKNRYSVRWDEVVSVSEFKSDDPYSYDLCVPGPQNFVSNGIVLHNTEKNMRKLLEAIEAAAPCIVFIDEIDSVLSAGRKSGGDSGTSGRVFNSFMTFLSDPGRVGRIVVLAASNRPDLLDKALIRPGRFDAKIPILPPAACDVNGRKQILKALTVKNKVKFAKELEGTMKNPDDGLGRLLLDKERIWTGAEIEDLIREAMSSAAFSGRKTEDGKKDYTITKADWNYAMDVILPNTGDIEYQTKLALLYVNNLSYCPVDWQEQAKDKSAIRTELGLDNEQYQEAA
jgi:SpoVK/Ycf46/Vps4 family AAA+-type ATPase/intein/homing endonuclease